jgi:hypothetical protein
MTLKSAFFPLFIKGAEGIFHNFLKPRTIPFFQRGTLILFALGSSFELRPYYLPKISLVRLPQAFVNPSLPVPP